MLNAFDVLVGADGTCAARELRAVYEVLRARDESLASALELGGDALARDALASALKTLRK